MVSKHPPIGEGFIVPWEVKASPKTACSNFGEFLKIGVWCAKTLVASVSHIFDSDSEEEEFFGFSTDDIARADISGESDISADERSDESSTEDKESDSSSAESGGEEDWSDNLEFVIVEDFNKPTGPTTVLPATATSGDFLNLVFPEDLIQLIVDETNRNARQKQQQSGTVDKDWMPVNNSDIKVFVAKIPVESRRWYRYLAVFLIETAAVNAFVLRQLSPNHARTTQLKFRLELIDNLLGDYCSRKRSAGVMEVVDGKTHFPVKGPINRCMQCAKTGQRHRSTWRCALCDVTLCVGCFEPFHSL